MSDQNIQNIYALTPMQEGILYHVLRDPGAGYYFNQFTCQILGSLDAALFEEAWNIALQRHTVLRTLFTWERRDRPLQIVRRRVELPWSIVDLRERDPSAQQALLRDFLQADRRRGFALDEAPLTRVTLFLLGGESSRLVWSFHHIVLDGWSMRLVLDEVLELYQGLRDGSSYQLPPAPDYAAFVAWQRDRNQAGDLQFWKQRLAGFTTPTAPDIAPDRDLDESLAKPGQQTELRLDRQLSDALSLLARRERVTLNSVVVAAWALLLARYCDARDVVFGVTVAGRASGPHMIDKTAGLCINTLPLRLVLEPGMGLAELLAKTQAQLVAQQPYEHASLRAIQKHCGPDPATPLFETIVVFENLPEAAQRKSNALRISDRHFIEYSNFPLALLVVPGKELHLIAVHDGKRYSSKAVDRMLLGLKHLLRQFTAADTAALDAIAAVPDVERQQMLSIWNDTSRSLALEARSVVDLFERCVLSAPESVAIAMEHESVSYADLNRRANHLARYLQAHYQVQGKPLIIYAERSVDAIVGMLAALKSGAFYVPLDINDPDSRLELVTADLARGFAVDGAEAKPILLTQSSLLARLAGSRADIVAMDAIGPTGDDSNLDHHASSDDLAYVIYTSGSLGRPKGVMVQHGALLNSTGARYAFYDDSPGCFALLSSLATDSSLAGIYWTLCGGGQLVIPGHRSELAVDTLSGLIEARGVTHMLCVPSLYSLILEHAEPKRLQSLRVVIVAGEATTAPLVARHHHLLGGTRLCNEYGPSEACVWATAATLEVGNVSIGRPIANTTAYVLDSECRPVPVGAPGELYLGGANLALGYLGNADATAASFIVNPFDEGCGRLYRTGDRVRYRDDGNLEFIGRVDDQIKVRGYRVEPGEIEAVLVTHPDVESAAVFIDEPGLAAESFEALLNKADADLLAELLTDMAALDSQEVQAELARGDAANAGKEP